MEVRFEKTKAGGTPGGYVRVRSLFCLSPRPGDPAAQVRSADGASPTPDAHPQNSIPAAEFISNVDEHLSVSKTNHEQEQAKQQVAPQLPLERLCYPRMQHSRSQLYYPWMQQSLARVLCRNLLSRMCSLYPHLSLDAKSLAPFAAGILTSSKPKL